MERVKRAGFKIPDKLHYVPVDFTADNLCEQLLDAGFDQNKKTFFSWLGVSYYLSIEQIEAMLDSIASISADGSSLIFDYADENLFVSEVERVQNLVATSAATVEPMKSCFDDSALEKLLERHRLLIYEL